MRRRRTPAWKRDWPAQRPEQDGTASWRFLKRKRLSRRAGARADSRRASQRLTVMPSATPVALRTEAGLRARDRRRLTFPCRGTVVVEGRAIDDRGRLPLRGQRRHSSGARHLTSRLIRGDEACGTFGAVQSGSHPKAGAIAGQAACSGGFIRASVRAAHGWRPRCRRRPGRIRQASRWAWRARRSDPASRAAKAKPAGSRRPGIHRPHCRRRP